MYKNILVPMDGSTLAECVLPHVEGIAKAFNPESVTFIQVIERFLPIPKGDDMQNIDPKEYLKAEEALKTAAEKYLKQLAVKAKYGSAKVNTVVTLGHPADRIAQYAKDKKMDAIVMSTHGRSGITRWAMGSVADRLLHVAPVPVFVIRAPGCAVS